MDKVRQLFARKSYRAKEGAASMTAFVYGKGGEMRMADDIKIPALSSTQCLVRVHCAAINHIDYKKPEIPFQTTESEPVGVEFVGTIEKLGWVGGDKVHMFPFAIGDVVFGMSSGTLAEFVVAEAGKISFKLDGMDDEQAAAFPVSGLAAYQSLKFNKFAAGQSIAVIGASDATGNMFLKQAKLLGASRVVGICNEEQQEFVLGCGADEVYTYEEIENVVGDCDLVVDLVSDPNKKNKDGSEPHYFSLCKPHMKKGSRFVAINANHFDMILKLITESIGFNVQRPGFDAATVTPRSTELKELADWFEEGKLAQAIDSIIPFEEAALLEGFNRLKSREARGKIVVRM